MSAFDDTMGLRLIEAGDGRAVYRFTADASHHNPTGRLHGGAICSLADAAMGAAFMSVVGEDDGTNLDLHIQFLRPVEAGRLTAAAEVVHHGRTRFVLQCVVRDDEERIVARATSNFLRLPKKSQTIVS